MFKIMLPNIEIIVAFDAEVRLRECEECFHRSYGPNLERLVKVKVSLKCQGQFFKKISATKLFKIKLLFWLPTCMCKSILRYYLTQE